jgi:uncharacterized membrane protein YidH (DUF202 family)
MILTIVAIITFLLFFKIIDYIGDWQQIKSNEDKKETIESFQIVGTVILIIIVIAIFITYITL